MIFELSQTFYFEAAHTLNREIDTASSRRIHGHTYHAEVFVRGLPNSATGMVLDIGVFRQSLAEMKEKLDHRFLDEIPNLGTPTLENLCLFIKDSLESTLPGLAKVSISRPASGDTCTLIVN